MSSDGVGGEAWARSTATPNCSWNVCARAPNSLAGANARYLQADVDQEHPVDPGADVHVKVMDRAVFSVHALSPIRDHGRHCASRIRAERQRRREGVGTYSRVYESFASDFINRSIENQFREIEALCTRIAEWIPAA